MSVCGKGEEGRKEGRERWNVVNCWWRRKEEREKNKEKKGEGGGGKEEREKEVRDFKRRKRIGHGWKGEKKKGERKD